MLRLILLGHEPTWLGAALWLIIWCAAVLLWLAVRRQSDRERADRERERIDRNQLVERLDELAGRVDYIDHYLFAESEEDHQWPNSPPNQ